MSLPHQGVSAPVERVVGALEIGGFGAATSVGGFVLGLSQTGILIAVYAVTVVAAYALVRCLEHVTALPQPGND
ncbi:MAG TPA: hypothetical protein VFE23_04820 [Usitatibacter sp.]|jgi:hypothetical protein|nr:hypothetical protein [Usitatibacter sp.]